VAVAAQFCIIFSTNFSYRNFYENGIKSATTATVCSIRREPPSNFRVRLTICEEVARDGLFCVKRQNSSASPFERKI
jgi:hypothetical protein